MGEGANSSADIWDRHAVREVIGKYFAALDRADKSLLAECFSADARYESTGGTLNLDGREAICARLASAHSGWRSHVPSSMTIEIDGDRARADTFALAYLVEDAGADQRVIVRGVQYLDELRREAGEWRISRRYHGTQWQFEARTVEPFVP